MILTTGPASHDPARDIPELAPYARTTVRLHPRRGVPGARDSHIGGPLWWPAAEPWPSCGEHRDVNGRQLGPYPLVAVAQLTAADFPELRFPDGTDLVQVLWCTDWHDQPHPEGGVRRVSSSGAGRTTWPARPAAGRTRRGRGHGPEGVRTAPRAADGVPLARGTPPGLAGRHEAWLEERGLYDDVSTIPGCKLGGSMRWGVTDLPGTMECGRCRAPLELFLQLDTYEYDMDADDRFRPLEERHLDPRSEAGRAAREPTGMTVGRGGHAGLYVCSANPRHPASLFTQ